MRIERNFKSWIIMLYVPSLHLCLAVMSLKDTPIFLRSDVAQHLINPLLANQNKHNIVVNNIDIVTIPT
jgi:hypothetical protein